WRVAVVVGSLILRRRPSAPLFPYTTLFRSHVDVMPEIDGNRSDVTKACRSLVRTANHKVRSRKLLTGLRRLRLRTTSENAEQARSEEHTSELQSRENLVCRLLLEKKKITCT